MELIVCKVMRWSEQNNYWYLHERIGVKAHSPWHAAVYVRDMVRKRDELAMFLVIACDKKNGRDICLSEV